MRWSVGMTLEEVEKEAIIDALKFFKDNKTMAAQALGITRRTIHQKLEKYAKEDAEKAEKMAKDSEKYNEQRKKLYELPILPEGDVTVKRL